MQPGKPAKPDALALIEFGQQRLLCNVSAGPLQRMAAEESADSLLPGGGEAGGGIELWGSAW